jgi:hypothetical protein
MKITLRKANTVQAAINEALKALELRTTVVLNEFEKAESQIAVVRDKFNENLETRNRLVTALYEIRRAVANTNANAGINDLLAEVAQIEKQLAFYNGLVRSGAQLSDSVINGRLERVRNAKEERFYGRDEITTSIFTEPEVDSFKRSVAEFKRQKQKLQDRLLELNVQTEIELSENVVNSLNSVDIL